MTIADRQKFQMFHWRRSKTRMAIVSQLPFRAGIFLAATFFATLVLWLLAGIYWPFAFISVIGMGIVAFFVMVVALDTARSFLRGLFKPGRNLYALGPRRMTVSAKGIREEATGGVTEREWYVFEEIAETPEYLFVYTSGWEAFIIPKRAFLKEQDLRQFATSLWHYHRRGDPTVRK
ncbi:MAG: YcxB family protein [Planctomycetia bacterium]|nr:YcxB family protein [Planctomycetia bacterium]